MNPKEKFLKSEQQESSKSEKEGKFEYSYEFPGGEKFEVAEREDGMMKIILKKDNQDIFDFSTLLPEDWKFVSEDYVRRLSEKTKKEIPWIGWLADHDRKLIQIEDFESPKDFLTLLHEIGHAQKNQPEDLKKYNAMLERLFPADINFPKPLKKEHARIADKVEREAWDYGLALLKKLEKQFDLDLKKIFPTQDRVKSFINENLLKYRKIYEKTSSSELDPEFYEELKKLFDKA